MCLLQLGLTALDVCNVNQKALCRIWRRKTEGNIRLRMPWYILYPRAAGHVDKLNIVSILILSSVVPRVCTTGRGPHSVFLLEVKIFNLIQTQSYSGKLQKIRSKISRFGSGKITLHLLLYCSVLCRLTSRKIQRLKITSLAQVE